MNFSRCIACAESSTLGLNGFQSNGSLLPSVYLYLSLSWASQLAASTESSGGEEWLHAPRMAR